MSKRNHAVLGEWGPRGTRVIAAESYWRLPIRWNREAAQAGERRRVFCASLADVFEGPDTMPESEWGKVEAARVKLLHLIIPQTPHLDWLLLTKRPENIKQMVHQDWIRDGFPPHVWIGTSVEDQQTANERIPHLLSIPARVRFLSMEPLLGPVDLGQWVIPACEPVSYIDWIIVGGESGKAARPMHPAWVRSLRNQAAAAGVPFFMKQHGEYVSWSDLHYLPGSGPYGPTIHPWTSDPRDSSQDPTLMVRVGKKIAGRSLDGREWNEVPE